MIAKSASRFVLCNIFPESLFDAKLPLPQVKSLFSDFVKLVEIENHSYCNRTCWFCPNSVVDRLTSSVPMAPQVLSKILDNLAEIDYSQTVVWARYHEPLAHPSIYENISTARRRLPRAYLKLHTNGDYLNQEVIQKLSGTGIDNVGINLYVPNGQEHTQEAVDRILDQLSRRTGLVVGPHPADEGRLHLLGSDLYIPIHIPNFKLGMSSRGGVLVQVIGTESYRRTSACFSPIQHVNVDFNGKGVLCCQVRSDVGPQSDTVIGDLSIPEYTVFHMYRDLAPARKALVAPGPKGGVCQTCNQNLGGPDKSGRLPLVANTVGRLPGVGAATRALWRKRARRYDVNVSS